MTDKIKSNGNDRMGNIGQQPSTSSMTEPLLRQQSSSTSNSVLPNFYSSASYKETFDNNHHRPYQTLNQNARSIQSGHPSRQKSNNNCSTSSLSSPSSSSQTSLYSSQSYDVVSRQQTNDGMHGGQGRTSWIMAAFLLINAALGAGLLNYPVAYDRLGGIVYATIIQVFAAVLMISTILVLIYCAQINNEDSYHGVMRTMCGRGIMQLSAASIAITCFGICVTFIIIIGDQFDRIFATYIGPEFCINWYANRFFTMSATAIVATWPMCYFRRLDFLRHVNVLGVLASFYIIFLNVYSYFYQKRDPDHTYTIRTSPESALEFVAALPVVFFAYQTHEIVIPVYDSMSEKNIRSFSKSIMSAMAALLLLYCLAGSFGYLTFGSKVAPDIMLMYDANDPVVLAGIVALIVKMITTYPPVVFCGRDTIVRLVLSRYYQTYRGYQCLADSSQRDNPIISHERRWNIIITTIWNVVVLILAIVIPNITIAIGFLGSLASCNVFIFPGLALLALAKRYVKISRQRKVRLDNGLEDPEDEEPFGKSKKMFNLKNRWWQNALQLYGLFIIGLGVTMFVIILIQVYHDFHQQTEHGAVCDVKVVMAKMAAAIGNNTRTNNHKIIINSIHNSSNRYQLHFT